MSQHITPDVDKLRSTIKHVVVLMLENRSFDNLLGWLYADAPPPNGQFFEGLTPSLWNSLDNVDSDGVPFTERVPVAKNGAPKTFHGKPVANPVRFTLPDPDPGEGFKDTNYQLYQSYDVALQYPPPALNMGFVQNYQNAMMYGTFQYGDEPGNPRSIMTCYTPEQVPVLSELARSFAVCDHYHCSIPSQTLPNRDFMHAATSTGYVNNTPQSSCGARTIFNQIQEAIDAGRSDLSWGVFGNNIAGAGDTGGAFSGNHFSLTRLMMTQLHDARFDQNFTTRDVFAERCRDGTLPSYSFLEPTYSGDGQNDQHPPSDIRAGEQLIADVYNMIRTSPAFANTLLVITYDEHGGCYDHVPPPAGARNPDPANAPGQDGFRFNRFGVRVPCVVVNPSIARGLVARPAGFTPFDHTSIIKTIQLCFALSGSLTERDKAAPDFSGMLTLDSPRPGADIPDVQPLARNPPAGLASVNELHRLIGQTLQTMTGTDAPPPVGAEFWEFLQRAYNSLFARTS